MKLQAPSPHGAAHTSSEMSLLGICLFLLACALAAPSISQPPSYHDFADQRALWHLPFAMDVLSNLPFALWGIAGLWRAWPGKPNVETTSASQVHLALLFFTGLVLTSLCSTWYHLNPGDAGLLVDRGGMTVAFAGLLGLAAAGRVSTRAGWCLAILVMVCGPLSITIWSATGNLTPWIMLQLGGMALILWFALQQQPEGALPVRWGLVILIYTIAKLLELADHQVFELTHHFVSGHSLKHVVASMSALPVLMALRQLHQTKAESSGG